MALQMLAIAAVVTCLAGLLATGGGSEVERPDLLTNKTIDAICNINTTSICKGNSTDPDSVCTAMANNAQRGNDSVLSNAQCDDVNTCSFLALKNGSSNALVYVSYQNKCSSAMNGSVTYKKCKNGLIVYSLYE